MSTGSGAASVIGLDYAGVRAGLEMALIEVTPRLWAELQLVEHGALDALNEERR